MMAGLAGSSSGAGEPSGDAQSIELQQQIDRLVEEVAIGPLAPRCGDSDFLRRIYLDLTGVIPNTDRVREFLADNSPDKRQRVVDALLDSRDFSRFMVSQLTVLLLERRTEKNVKQQDWERYLLDAIEEKKPLDQLFSELIFAEPTGSGLHPATKFILNREVEPNAVTRDVGRLLFGMDLQCAQCHNHPLIDAYLQEDYYGLFAFLNRTSLFTDPTTKEIRLAEKAEGEVSFKSVFTGDSRDRTVPRLPKEFSLFNEPTFAVGDEYRVKPEKNAAGQPKFSRRAALAKMLSSSQQFQRNLANRIWALMFSRGIVHPLDFHHVANSPSNPALLQLLSRELKSNGFQIRPLLRAIALTRTYQRSCEAPLAETVNFADIAARLQLLTSQLESRRATISELNKAAEQRDATYRELLSQHDSHEAEVAKLSKAVAEARQNLEKALATQKSAQETLGKLQLQSRAVAEAAAKSREAAQTIPDDKVLAEAAAKIAERAMQLTGSVEASTSTLAEKSQQCESARSEVSEIESKLAAAVAARVDPERLKQLEVAQVEASESLSTTLHEIQFTERQIALCETINKYKSVEQTDSAQAVAQWQAIVDQWTIAGQVAPLKPLSPEQMTTSAMQATGMLAPQIAAVEAQIDKSPPELLKNASDANKGRMKAKLLQLELIDGLRGTIGQFVTHYGGLPGEDFQATVNQALFFGNGSIVDGWLRPANENLVARLLKIENPHVLADELYLSILSRPALEPEKRDIAESLKQFEGERVQVIGELTWALLSSNEFRFNH